MVLEDICDFPAGVDHWIAVLRIVELLLLVNSAVKFLQLQGPSQFFFPAM